jgi:hypothetical protein
MFFPIPPICDLFDLSVPIDRFEPTEEDPLGIFKNWDPPSLLYEVIHPDFTVIG